jgi:hypothetical protein
MICTCRKDPGTAAPAQWEHQPQNPTAKILTVNTDATWAQAVAGTWDVRVTLRDCGSGASLANLRAVDTFSPCGALLENGARTASNPGSFGQGSWRHLAGKSYAAVLQFFHFNHDGSVAETQKVTRRLEISADGMSFTGTAVVEVYDTNDGLISAHCATETAKRFENP